VGQGWRCLGNGQVPAVAALAWQMLCPQIEAEAL
jgi:hypothetical protein